MAETNRIQQKLILENFIVIWLDANQNSHDKSSINRFQQFVNLILSFDDCDQCIDFLTDIKDEKIFLIVSDTFGQQIVSLITNLDQIDSVYVYCKERGKNEKWALKEKKIKGVFTKIEPIYDAFRRDIRQCEDDLIPFSILSSNYNQPNHSDQLFIVTQLMKEILLEMEYPPNSKIDFKEFCASIYQNNTYQLKLIEEFRMDYQASSSIRWYTSECFIYSILNKAFRIRDMDILIKMGFFIRDLHQQIQRLHSKLNKQNRLMVYRGQGISEEAFGKLLHNINGFISFDNFLITTTDKQISLAYARSARNNHGLIGVVFHMDIDQTQSLFTPLDKISYYSESDKEILFSTHTIFRIVNIQNIENDLWQIQLKLTKNEDRDLKRFLRKDIEGKNELERLNILRTQLGIMDGSNKAQDTSEKQSTFVAEID